MKKTIAILLALTLCAAMLAACGGGKGLSGKYKLTSMTEDGVTVVESGFAEWGFSADEFYLEFLDGTKFKMVMIGETHEGTYKLDGKTLSLTVDGDKTEAKIDGSKITLEESGSTMIFEKK